MTGSYCDGAVLGNRLYINPAIAGANAIAH